MNTSAGIDLQIRRVGNGRFVALLVLAIVTIFLSTSARADVPEKILVTINLPGDPYSVGAPSVSYGITYFFAPVVHIRHDAASVRKQASNSDRNLAISIEVNCAMLAAAGVAKAASLVAKVAGFLKGHLSPECGELLGGGPHFKGIYSSLPSTIRDAAAKNQCMDMQYVQSVLVGWRPFDCVFASWHDPEEPLAPPLIQDPEQPVPTQPLGGCTRRAETHNDRNTGQAWSNVWYCGNAAGAPLYVGARVNGSVVSRMDTTYSWFACYRRGEQHAGGNNIWYYTQGDRATAGWQQRESWGYIPAVNVWTNTDPYPGIPECRSDAYLILPILSSLLLSDEVDNLIASGPNRLTVGQRLTSADGRFHLIMQADGNLVLYRRSDGAALWSSGTYGRGATSVTMQGDGNLVLYKPDGAPVWSTSTYGQGAVRALLQNDGNFVLYKADGHPVWSSNTCCH